MLTDKTIPLTVTPRQKAVLNHLQSQSTAEHRLVMRATIMLFAAEGNSTSFIADSLHVTRDTVMLWQKRWIQQKAKLDSIEPQENEKALLAPWFVPLMTNRVQEPP